MNTLGEWRIHMDSEQFKEAETCQYIRAGNRTGEVMYSFDGRIRYSEIGEEGRLTIGSAIDYMQDCSTFQSEDLGIGLEFLERHKTVWLLNSWQIEFLEMPRLGERIHMGTWAYDFNSLYGFRNFLMERENGTALVKANSVWVWYDLEKGRPARVLEEDVMTYGVEEKLDMEYLPRKVKVLEGGSCQESILVKKHLLDTNHHVNNGQYIRLAGDYLPEGFQVKRIRAEYKKSAVLGDCMIPRIVEMQEGYQVVLEDKEEKPYVVMEFTG